MVTIDRIDSCLLDIPTIRGHVLSMTTMMQQTIMVVVIRFSDGSIGLGEGATIGGLSYCSESPESMKSAVDHYIAPILRGDDADNINALILKMERAVRGNPIARCAVETALWDGLAKRKNCSIAALFGGAVQDRLSVAWALASGNKDRDCEEATEMLATQRHNIFKIKIGKRSVRDDIAHVAAIKETVGDQASIRVDVNQAWSLHDARWGLRGLQEVGVDLVEQPCAHHLTLQTAELVKLYDIAVMADEALQGPETAMQVAMSGAADVFSIKIAQSGGLKRANEVITIANNAGIGLYGGTMLEAGLGTAMGMQLLATHAPSQWGTEFFGPLLLKDEILSMPLDYGNFSVGLPKGPGVGVSLDPDKVAFYQREGSGLLENIA